jgi:hypothetical protein
MAAIWKTCMGLTALLILLFSASSWADSKPVEIQCLSQQLSDSTNDEVGFLSKAGVLRSKVLMEIFTATN